MKNVVKNDVFVKNKNIEKVEKVILFKNNGNFIYWFMLQRSIKTR